MKALLIALNLTLVACALTATVLHRSGHGEGEQVDSFRAYKKRLAALAKEIDGTLVYQRRDPEDRTASSIWMKALDGDQPTRLAESGRVPRWSPDGKSVVFLHGDTVCLVDRDSREIREVITLPDVEEAVFFDPQTLTVSGTSDEGWIKQVNLESGTATDLLSGHPFTSAALVPDSSYVAASIRGKSGGHFAFRFSREDGSFTRLGIGTPTSLSPSHDRMLFNRASLTEAAIIDVTSCHVVGKIRAPESRRLLNHRWSNHADYVVSTSKDFGNNIFVHHLPTQKAIQATKTADTNYPDLWID